MSREAGRIVCGRGSGQEEESVMVMHTGMGGQRLPIDNIIQCFPKLQQNMGTTHDHWIQAARGICTTDTFFKLASRTFTLPSSPETTSSIAGITKGAGMIHLNMATTLGIICTDAPITPRALQQLLSTAADKSYNCISIEGDTSTNDMVAMLANGAAAPNNAHFPIDFDSSAESQSEDLISFQRMLIEFMADLAKLVVRDGEGATKFITIRVRGAPTYPAGKHIASAIARSVLFKIGVYVSFMPVDGTEELNFVKKGGLVKVDEVRAKKLMEEEDVEVIVDLRDDGRKWREDDEEAVYWTCDITHEFVMINGDFRN
ncbi:dfa0be5c-e44f-403b-af95-708abb1d74cf [Sclerotinia trifoliorum]|uniref:Arginine biosynthesis bifunctional protein ArgJ, mitochondrial n=1 Tax=Sclerotinia trifoliorum TaxID=28548 RepID=A0A8H2VSC4_9HELO|nr:dfa0be5c-e44f-403b-af95-708abb1d74cf [Sclerotinia trifoliorum]